jgi:glycosyltransferase involved in cell wall biosynthesis
MPAVSVIVPNYNHARYLRRRVDSILAQTYRDFELILLDDCSTDNSREILADYARDSNIQVECNSENSGSVFKQWNKGVQKARGRYIWIAESDDYADPRFLARMVAILDARPDVTFAYCGSCRVDEEERHLASSDPYLDRLDADRWRTDFVVDGPRECQQFLVICSPIANASAVVFRKDVYDRVGQADERFRLCGDYKVWAQMALEGKIAYVAEPLSYFRAHPENVRSRTRAEALDVSEMFYVMLSILDRVAPEGTLADRAGMGEILRRLPWELNPDERLELCKKSLSYLGTWNLRHNPHLRREAMRAHFTDWNFALIGREFEISPPSRWRFFLHRCRFYQQYFDGMDWKQRLVNLGRVVGALVVRYEHRHWPEKALARFVRARGTP